MDRRARPLSATRRLGVVRATAGFAIALAIPLFLVTNAVRSVALDLDLYVSEFARYRVGTVTGLSDAELRRVASAFIAYFQSEPQELQIYVNANAGLVPLFNDREVHHMVDVQQLMAGIFQIRIVALLLLAAGALAMVVTGPRTAAGPLLKSTAIGGAIAVVGVGALALAAALDFNQLFLQFHFLSFSNDLWLLDPRRDRLIQLFPSGFFFDLAMRIGIQTVGFGLAILVASLGLRYALAGRHTTQ